MGSHSSKQDYEYTDLLISRCPRRNRGIKNIILKDEGTGKNVFEKKDRKDLVINNKTYKAETDRFEKHEPKFEVEKRKNHKQNLSSLQLVLKDENSSESESLKQNSKFQKNEVYGIYKNKKKKSKQRQQNKENMNLLTDILETVADLEATFIEEKKYERKLLTAVAAQVQELQQFSISLHKEKDQNKRLRELLNFCENEVEVDVENQNFSKYEKPTSLLDRSLFDSGTNLALSPLLLQQKIDELSSSLSRCKAELCIKNKQFILSQCEQEELQAKCDEFAEKLQTSNERIDSLSQEIVALKREKKILKKSANSLRSNGFKSCIASEISPKLPINKDKAE